MRVRGTWRRRKYRNYSLFGDINLVKFIKLGEDLARTREQEIQQEEYNMKGWRSADLKKFLGTRHWIEPAGRGF